MNTLPPRASSRLIPLVGAFFAAAAVIGDFIAERKIMWNGVTICTFAVIVWRLNSRRQIDRRT